ncbi:hypothetical protein A1D31_37945 [Bradyrhizobium liaoningense]|nr:hypothetical protein A1D31_37945 [Bradyrhizobium liaoningense]
MRQSEVLHVNNFERQAKVFETTQTATRPKFMFDNLRNTRDILHRPELWTNVIDDSQEFHDVL